MYTDAHSHVRFFSVLALRRTFDALATAQHLDADFPVPECDGDHFHELTLLRLVSLTFTSV